MKNVLTKFTLKTASNNGVLRVSALVLTLCLAALTTANAQFPNPVLRDNVPDPTIIRGVNDIYYIYGTGGINDDEKHRNIPIYSSKDLLEWEYVGTAFTDNTRPNFEPNAGLWAPDINFIGGQYVLYYAMSVWGGEKTCGIGRAVASAPYKYFNDLGMLFRSNEIGVQNSIDPNYFEDDGHKYLFWGSYHGGIWGIELTDNGLNLKPDAKKKQIADKIYEGAYIHKRNGWYYLFASIGFCCDGLNSTYKLVVGRSKNLWGPYLNKKGKKMLDGHHELLLDANSDYVGCGHNSEIITDSKGDDYIFYHGYVRAMPNGREVFIDMVTWDNDWPSIGNGTPSKSTIEPSVRHFSGDTTF